MRLEHRRVWKLSFCRPDRWVDDLVNGSFTAAVEMRRVAKWRNSD